MERAAKSRVDSVDALRGFVMIVMALDHVRDFFHSGAQQFLPDDLTRTTSVLFFTRWITHFCAPVFMFTAGIGAFFWWNRGRTTGQLTGFLVKRGIWLIFLDQIVVRFALFFGLTSGPVILNVLWALGWSMIILGLLAHLPIRVLAVVSIATIALHNLLDPVQAAQFGAAAGLWNILHQQGVFRVGSVIVVAAYPLVPWFAVMAAGFCFGRILLLDPPGRRRMIARLGLAMTIVFVAIRAINVYGDPVPWSDRIPGTALLSFLRCAKYPPSLDFLLMTLGPALLLLAWFDGRRFSPGNPLIVFGRVPLFYFLLHLLLAHALAIPLALIRYGRMAFLLNPSPNMGGPMESYPPGYGYPLPVVYLIWIAVVCLLYPVCLWFGRLKQRRRDWWLSYL
jgi:uncharacterized membrane protein